VISTLIPSLHVSKFVRGYFCLQCPKSFKGKCHLGSIFFNKGFAAFKAQAEHIFPTTYFEMEYF
jgi:hypothetical protein